ncbi:hypothetical protein OG226_49625 [Streptomyces sp. NBC_01261]|uniref:hypothetical protein n=1 Tax=unclassified Streptomyces TaxID=2593676 RepID=UPI002E2E0001|nr:MULTISPECIES: hypothetical protein [unclassified Streptomyces]
MAFDLGDCDGVRTYRKISTFFPQHGERFDPSLYIDLCTGEYSNAPWTEERLHDELRLDDVDGASSGAGLRS